MVTPYGNAQGGQWSYEQVQDWQAMSGHYGGGSYEASMAQKQLQTMNGLPGMQGIQGMNGLQGMQGAQGIQGMHGSQMDGMTGGREGGSNRKNSFSGQPGAFTGSKFEELIEREMHNVKRMFIAEYRRSSQRLEAKASALESENTKLRKEYRSLLDAMALDPSDDASVLLKTHKAPLKSDSGVAARSRRRSDVGRTSLTSVVPDGGRRISAGSAISGIPTSRRGSFAGIGMKAFADGISKAGEMVGNFGRRSSEPGVAQGDEEGGKVKTDAKRKAGSTGALAIATGDGRDEELKRVSPKNQVSGKVASPKSPSSRTMAVVPTEKAPEMSDPADEGPVLLPGLVSTYIHRGRTQSTSSEAANLPVLPAPDLDAFKASKDSTDSGTAGNAEGEAGQHTPPPEKEERHRSSLASCRSSQHSVVTFQQQEDDNRSSSSESGFGDVEEDSREGKKMVKAVSAGENASKERGSVTSLDSLASHEMSNQHHFQILDTWELAKDRLMILENTRRSRRRSTVMGPVSNDLCSYELENDDDEDNMHWLDHKLSCFVLNPSSMKRLVWELLGFTLVLYDIVVLPLQYIDERRQSAIVVMAWLTRIFWTLDVQLSCFTGYASQETNGLTELRPSRVALRYAKTRLPLDLVIVGCDWMEVFVPENTLQLTGALRVMRCFRLARLAKARNIVDHILNNIRSEGKMIAGYVCLLVVCLLLLIHVMACVWSGIRSSKWGGYNDVQQTEWEDIEEKTNTQLAKRYLQSFHYVLALFVGEHIVLPVNIGQRIFTVLMLILAFVVSAFFVGSLTTAMTRLQHLASQRSAQFAALNRYLSDCRISNRLSMRVQRNARHALHERTRNTPESMVELLSYISEPLRSEIHYEVYFPTLTRHPFFFLYNRMNPAGVRQICHNTVHVTYLSRGDVLFSEFEVPAVAKMFFICSGRLAYSQGLAENHKVYPRQWLSEAALWTTWAHRGLLQARAECRLLAVDATRFVNIMTTFPTLHAYSYGELYVERLREAEVQGAISDIGEDSETARQLACDAFQKVDPEFDNPKEWRPERRASLDTEDTATSSRLSSTDLSWFPRPNMEIRRPSWSRTFSWTSRGN